MLVHVYKGTMCEDDNRIRLPSAADVDHCINAVLACIQDLTVLRDTRIFITDDNVDPVALDHFVLMDEPIPGYKNALKEVDLEERAKVANETLRAAIERKEKSEEARQKILMMKKPDLLV